MMIGRADGDPDARPCAKTTALTLEAEAEVDPDAERGLFGESKATAVQEAEADGESVPVADPVPEHEPVIKAMPEAVPEGEPAAVAEFDAAAVGMGQVVWLADAVSLEEAPADPDAEGKALFNALAVFEADAESVSEADALCVEVALGDCAPDTTALAV